MSAKKIRPVFREALAVHEAFRRLGFASDDLFFCVANKNQVFVKLIHEGKDFAVICGQFNVPAKQLFDEWKALLEEVNDGSLPEDTMQEIWASSFVYKGRASFITALLTKGFPIPRNEAKTERKEATWIEYLESRLPN